MLKALSFDNNITYRLLAGGLVNRRLFRTVFSSEPFSEDAVSDARGIVAQLLNIDQARAADLVITGLETVPTYDPGQGEIRFLRKDGTVVPLQEMLESSTCAQVHQRYYLCYPVKV
jgi:hypothetical protein